MDINLLAHSPVFAYIIIFFGMLLEAIVTLFAVVFAVARGYLNPFLALLILVLGAVTEQLIWYYVGKNLHRFQKIIHFSNKFVGHLDSHFNNRSLYLLVLSKFIYGLHRTVLIRFGMLHFSLKKYLRAGLVAISLWLAIVGSLAYVFSASYDALKHYFKYAEIIILFVIAGFGLLQYFISKRIKRDL